MNFPITFIAKKRIKTIMVTIIQKLALPRPFFYLCNYKFNNMSIKPNKCHIFYIFWLFWRKHYMQIYKIFDIWFCLSFILSQQLFWAILTDWKLTNIKVLIKELLNLQLYKYSCYAKIFIFLAIYFLLSKSLYLLKKGYD